MELEWGERLGTSSNCWGDVVYIGKPLPSAQTRRRGEHGVLGAWRFRPARRLDALGACHAPCAQCGMRKRVKRLKTRKTAQNRTKRAKRVKTRLRAWRRVLHASAFGAWRQAWRQAKTTKRTGPLWAEYLVETGAETGVGRYMHNGGCMRICRMAGS